MSTMHISEHYERRRQLDLLEAEDARRKQLIRLCVLRVVTLSNTKTSTTKPAATDNVEELTQKCLNYELTINKLKQEWNTKDKLNEATVDKLKEDIAKLKQQKAKPGVRTSVLSNPTFGGPFGSSNATSIPKTSLSYATSPYLSRAVGSKNFLSPTVNSLNKSTAPSNPMLVSPIGNRRGKYITAKTMKKAPQVVGNPLVTPTGQNKRQKAADWSLSPNKSPTRMSFVENFDNSDSNDDTPLFNDNFRKEKPAGFVVSKTNMLDGINEADGPDANSTAIMGDEDEPSANADKSTASTDDETFASANSTLDNSIEKSKRKQLKRLNLAGSSVAGNATRSVSRGLSVEQDGVNSLDYYKDGNFTEGNEESPKASRTVVSDLSMEKKKKRRVFKIN